MLASIRIMGSLLITPETLPSYMAKWIPNYLTFLRLALVPVFVILMIDPSPGEVYAATLVFIFAAITDYADGIIARRYGAISDFGKLMDPMADKLLVMAALVMLVEQRSDIYGEAWVPGWMVVMVLAREIWVTGLRAIAASGGQVVPAGQAGKFKSFAQMVAIVCLLLHDSPLYIFGFKTTFQWIGLNLLFISIAFSYWGAAQYSAQIFRKHSLH